MEKMMWKRFIAGFMAFALLFLSVDHGCITAVAADLQDKSIDIQYNTGRLDVHMVPITVEESKEISFHHYVKYDGANYGSAYYKNEWEKYSSYYYYNQLSDDYKEAWDALNDLCLSYLTSEKNAELIQFSDGTSGYYTAQISMPEGCTEKDLELFYNLFVMSNPQYFFIANGMLYAEDFSKIGLQMYDSWVTGTERAKATELFKTKIDLAINHINQGTTLEEKLLLAHDYIVENVEYYDEIIEDDYIDFDEEHASYSQSAYSALCLGLTVCAGYSEAMQLLCNGVGIDTLCVTSNIHQWNKVRINGSWYNIDTTWADQEDGDKVKYICYKYYARNDDAYITNPDHIMMEFWDEIAPKCLIDVTPKNELEAPGDFPLVERSVVTPTFSVEKSESNYIVTITTTTDNATIYYTLDGTTPASASSKSYVYKEPFVVPADTVINAIAVHNEYLDSEIISVNTSNIQVNIQYSNKYSYTGEEIDADFVIYNSDGEVLVEDKDYKIETENNINVGTATAKITFIGDYSALNPITKTFEIEPINYIEHLDKFRFEVIDGGNGLVYTGEEIKADVKVYVNDEELTKDVDYKLEYHFDDYINVGTKKVSIVFIKNYHGTHSCEYELLSKNGANLVIEDVQKQEYTGAAITPELVIKDGDYTLVKNKDYKVTYTNNTAIGTATVNIMFMGNYVGEAEAQFEIIPVSSQSLTFVVEKQIYTGNPLIPNVIVTYGNEILEQGKDYLVEFEDLPEEIVDAGSYSVKVVLQGNYSGTKDLQFEILPIEIATEDLTLDEVADIIFTGDIVYPEVIVRCERLGLTSEDGSLWVEVDYAEGVDYTNVGIVEFTAYLVGNYSGSITGSFKIVPITIDENQDELIIANIAKQEYTGKPILPSVQIMYDGVLLEEGVDYELSVEEGGNIEIGSVELVINFIGNYTGNATKTFEIVPPKSQSITSDKVDVNDETGYISKISADTTVADFIASLGDDVTVKILKGETTVEGSALLGTGMKVCVMNAGQVVNEYTVIVTGDTNGDGKISITDMIAAKAHLLNKELLTGASAKAADVAGATDGGDGKISITDFIKVKAHLLKKDAIEGVVVK